MNKQNKYKGTDRQVNTDIDTEQKEQYSKA